MGNRQGAKVVTQHVAVFSVLLALAILVLWNGATITGNPVLVSPSAPSITIGTQVRVDVNTSAMTNLAGVEISISFNNAVLQYNRTTEGLFLNQSSGNTFFDSSAINTSTAGQVQDIVIFRYDGVGVSGTGTVASVYFDSIGAGTSNIAFTKILLANSSGQSITDSNVTTSVAVIIPDSTPPTASITAPVTNTWTADTTPDITILLTDNSATTLGYTMYVDNVIFNQATVPNNTATVVTLTAVSQGARSIKVQAADAAGNKVNSTIITLNVDATAPATTIDAPANNTITNDTTPDVTFTTTDALDTTLDVIIYVNNTQNTVRTAPSGAQQTQALSVLAPGNWSIKVQATDNAGNRLNSTARTIIVDTTAPTGSVTRPLAASYVGGVVTINATASDTNGIAGVTFYRAGTTIIGTEDTTSPYSTPWDTTSGVTDGSHTITARIRDNAGNSVTTSGVTVTVDNTAPTATMTLPLNNSVVRGTISLNATASDGVGVVGVQFTRDGVNEGTEDLTSTYGIPWITTGVADGPYTIAARARDNIGTTGTSGTFRIVVDNTAPTVTFTTITNNTKQNQTITLGVSATDTNNINGGIRYYVDGVLNTTDASAPYSIQWNTSSVADGVHTLIASATDDAGNMRNTSMTLYIDNTGPTVSMTMPANNAVVAGTTVTVTATASDPNNVSNVQFLLNGNSLQTPDNSNPYSISWDTTSVPNGTYALSARATDSYSNTQTSSSITVNVQNVGAASDTAAPAITLSTPANGAAVRGSITVSASANDNGVLSGVQFFRNGANLDAEDTSDPYSVTWDSTGVADGNQNFAARARDSAGNTNTTTNITVSVDNTNPTGSITAPTNAATVSGVVTITTSASDATSGVAGITFLRNGSAIAAENTSTSVSWNTSSSSNGVYNLTALIRDNAGNTFTTTGVSVTVNNAVVTDTVAPTVSITAPASSATITGTITITATASDNIGVAGVLFSVNGNAIGSEDTSSPYSMSWDSRDVSNGARTITARVRDDAGNNATATVSITVSNTAAVPSGGGGGGGGGGLIPTSTTAAPLSSTVSYTGQNALGVTLVTASLSTPRARPGITITSSSADVSRVPNTFLYSAFTLTPVNFTNTDMGAGSVSFSIPNTWAEQNNINSVTLYEISGNTWTSLTTRLTSRTETDSQYSAATTRLGTFAITGSEQAAAVVIETPVEVIEEAPAPITLPEPDSHNMMYILVSVALAALLGAAVITAQIRRRSKLPSAEPKTGGMTKVEMLDPQTEGLRKYVKEMQNLGKTQQEIRATLVQAGWTAGVAERIAPDTVENVASSKTVT